jgi:hypothetical protein
MSSRELALVKDVGLLTHRPRPGGLFPSSLNRFVKSGWDLRITESEMTLSPTAETLVIGGTDTVSIPFAEVRSIKIKRDKASASIFLLRPISKEDNIGGTGGESGISSCENGSSPKW